MTVRLPMPALICFGAAGASAFITASASALPGQKRAITGRREDRIGEAALRRDDRDRPREPAVLRDRAVDDAVEQDRAQRQPDRAVDRALERHVDRPVRHLRRGSRQDRPASRRP